MTIKPIRLITLNGYLSKLNIIHRILLGIPFNPSQLEEVRKAIVGEPFQLNLDFLLDIDDVIQVLKIKYTNKNTFRCYLVCLAVILSRMEEFKKQYQIVSNLNIEYLKNYDEERNKNIILEKDKNKLISFSPEEIKNNLNKLDDITDALIYIFSIYFVRRLEIRLLKLAYDENDNDNLLIIDIDGYPTKVIFNNYKTSGTYKKQIIDIPPEIVSIIMRYIAIKDIQIGNYIFGLKKNSFEPLSQPNFSNKIKSVFNILYGANITNRWIRMSYATETGAEMMDIVKKYELDAKKLSHSTRTHHQYVKKNDS